MRTIRRDSELGKPLDDASDGAVALAAFVCRHRYPNWFPIGSTSAGYVEELARAGFLTVSYEIDHGVPIVRARWPWRRSP
jgi:hypothetical protein